MPGRMAVGRFINRAAALDYLVEKYSTEVGGKAAPVKYTLQDADTARVVFNFTRDFGGGKTGTVGYIGNGVDLTAAIADLFKQLGESVDEEVSNA